MRSHYFKTLKTAILAISVLLLGVSVSFAQQTVNLTAAPTSVTLPDGSLVPMWGYTACTVTGTAGTGGTQACSYLNPSTGWAPVVITVPSGQDLKIQLTNNLGHGIPTSLVIVGQLGGGLGDPKERTTSASPDHSNAQTTVTWPIVGSADPGKPPVQGARVQSFSTEVGDTKFATLNWAQPRAGTYLLESGTHPSIQGPMGLYGIVVVTTPAVAGASNTPGTAYPGVGYDADVPVLFSEIDPVQNNAVNAAVNTPDFHEEATIPVNTTATDNIHKCFVGTVQVGACYPPAVNYTPTYFLINGVAFDKSNATKSVFPTFPASGLTAGTQSILVRMVNAGLRMHVPSIVGAQFGAGAAGFGLIAEDGNPLPGATRVQSEVFMAAGKTYDVKINVPAAGGTALPIYDRELSLSGNAIARDAGMLAYIGANGAGLPPSPSFTAAVANADTYNAVVAGQTLTISDPGKGVIANDINVYGVTLLAQAAHGSVALNGNGTFTYTGATGAPDSFTYCANGTVTGSICSSGITATATLGASSIASSSTITCAPSSFTANTSKYLSIRTPGVLANCTDTANMPLTVDIASITNVSSGLTVVADANGGFSASATGAGDYSFTFTAKNSLNKTGSATATVTFQAGNGPTVKVVDGADKTTQITDYRWVIEEDRTFYVDPKCTTNPLPSGCPTATSQGAPAVFGTNFHTSWMPLVATGCTGPVSCEGGQTQQGSKVVCDQGNGFCRPDTTGNGFTAVDPSQVHLDPSKRYYISVLPGDAAEPFINGYAGAPDCSAAGVAAGSCGHGMGGAQIAAACQPLAPATTCTAAIAPVTVYTQPSPYPPAKLTVFVFEDDNPLNGEHDAGGGVDVLSPNEPGLGGFEITLFDDAGGTGDATGQPTYDMFNMPLTNSLAGTIDPVTGMDACPISKQDTANATQKPGTFAATPDQCSNDPSLKGCQKGVVGMIVTCPKFESDGVTLSPMAGQAIVNNLYQGRYGVVATPGADRIARGEEWLQTNTLDGQKAHDSFMRIGEPAYFQEFGPAGYHVTIGFANPTIINSRKNSLCTRTNPCNKEVKGSVTTARMSRPPDERLYGSGSRDSFSFTQCYASLGDPDGEDFAFVKCDNNGNFDFRQIPAGNWKLTLFDQWNDQIVDGISTPVGLAANATVVNLGEIATHQWQANIYTRTFIDSNGDGVSNVGSDGNPTEPGLALVATNIRFRDGSFSNFNNTDLSGAAGFNEIFPLFNWYTIETDTTRYKTTGVHVVYDAGGPTDTTCVAPALCGSSQIAAHFANTYEANPLPANLSVPGAVYCTNADCNGFSIAGGPVPSSTTNHSSGRIDPPLWFGSYGWQGFAGQNSFLEFGKKPYAVGETGGIHGHVVYASTRPFDDPQLLLQLSWEPLVPHVTVNLYKEDIAADGVTQTRTLVDTTQTSSFDDWAQGFRTDAAGNILKDASGNAIPNMNCPGQSNTDVFFYGLQNQPTYLDLYNSRHAGGSPVSSLPNSSQFKCYDGMHNWNQLQPAPYDGMYSFPSVKFFDPATGKPSVTNCHMSTASEPWGCIPNPDTTDPYRAGTPMLPAGKYVVEVVVPPGYELVKEEDKNILIGDNYIAPAVSQFAGLGDIFIMPDQAEIAAYNATNPQNPTTDLGVVPRHEGDTGSVESFWPCVGEARIVPDFISLFPGSAEIAPFAGASRNLCDRKEVDLTDQTSALVKFYVFTPTHIAAHYTGIITDDFTAEFDPFSPQFGEKFAPAYLPVSLKDWSGNEISRTYSDEFGEYTGLNYSTWEVNPPNPTGYGPTMMVTCMNDAGSGSTPDPLFQPAYSQFCYELPFMPGQTGYFDTPVVPTSAFSEGYNHPDCNYPAGTPAIREVDGDGVGPYVSAAGKTLTITSLGKVSVDSYGYSGPGTQMVPFNQQKVIRDYGFGTTPAGCLSTTGSPCPSVVLVGSDGIKHPLTGVNWSDTTITGTVPSGVPACAVRQQTQYGGSNASCGQLVITAANGKSSVDTVTVTIGGKAPTHIAATASIQDAIDAAKPGDLLIVDPTCPAAPCAKDVATTDPQTKITTYSNNSAAHHELVIMWKPVRLQGVGAVSSVIDANAHPAGTAKMDAWRQKVVCLFGLALNGIPISPTNPFDQSNSVNCSSDMNFAVDRLPLEATVGWDATLNGNLAEQLIEPTLLGAFEGAGITVLAKGVDFHGAYPWNDGTEPAAFPAATTLLTANNCTRSRRDSTNPFPSNFWCNPSSIDGLSVTNSSQGGGGIMVHGWGHNIQIANNRVSNNQGTLSGGITVGQGEHPDVYLAGVAPTTNPGSCESNNTANVSLPFCFDMNVNVHNNSVVQNSSLGDELFSSTPAGAGGVTLCSGSDYYKFNNNWVCGNMSTGDGGGVVHLGFTKNGDIEHNAILFNQSTNPTITTNGGGLLIMGAPDVDPPCSTNDQDCVSPPGTISPSDGTGPGLVVNANLIMGNAADSGSGGGLRLQHINGTDAINFPNGSQCNASLTNSTCHLNTVKVTNNIIANNVAGWDGGGVSLQDALAVNIVNNTIVSNDSTASSGVLFTSLFAPLASTPGTNCTVNNGSQSCPQVAGLVSITDSPVLQANLPTGFSCPTGHGSAGSCTHYSVPLLANNVIWQNRSFFIGVGGFGSQNQTQQKIVTLYNSFTTTAAPSQAKTGDCPAASYWDIGVRGDSGPGNHSGGLLSPTNSVLTDAAADYPGANNIGSSPSVVTQYCNGSRVPPELGSMGYTVNPGTNETNALPNPVFSLTPSATVDEGNNWINLRWGPLALTHPVSGSILGNYALATGSPAIDTADSTYAPPTDYFGNARPQGNEPDIGAVEFVKAAAADLDLDPSSLAFGTVTINRTSSNQFVTLTSSGSATLNVTGIAVTAPFARATGFGLSQNCPTSGTFALTAGSSCRIYVNFHPTTVTSSNGTLTVNASNDGSADYGTDHVVALSGTGSRLAVSPTTLNTFFTVGGGFSPFQTVTVSNAAGTGSTGAISAAVAGVTNGVTFQLAAPATGTNCLTHPSLNPGQACSFRIRFQSPTPFTAGTGTLNISDTEPATVSVALNGFRF